MIPMTDAPRPAPPCPTRRRVEANPAPMAMAVGQMGVPIKDADAVEGVEAPSTPQHLRVVRHLGVKFMVVFLNEHFDRVTEVWEEQRNKSWTCLWSHKLLKLPTQRVKNIASKAMLNGQDGGQKALEILEALVRSSQPSPSISEPEFSSSTDGSKEPLAGDTEDA